MSHFPVAYRKGYNCEHVLIRAVKNWTAAHDKGENVGCVFMDLGNACDSIPLGLLLPKLHAYVMSFGAFEFIRSYLTEKSNVCK